jgi:ADP-heptose:LPS heptosyltransferase
VPLKDSLKHLALQALNATWRAPDTPLEDIRTFVLLQHSTALGTAIHATPLIPALRSAVPDAQITVAASGFGLEVFRNNPGVNTLIDMPSPIRDRQAYKVLARHLPAGTFATLTPTGNERTAIALAARFAKAVSLCGFTLAPELYRKPLSYDPAISQIANNLRLVEALGHAVASTYEPKIFFTEADRAHAASLLHGCDPHRPLVAFVTQTFLKQRKSWRPERFLAAAKLLIERYGAQIVFVGSEGERAAVEQLRSNVQGTTWNIAGQTSISQLAALLSLCDIGLTLDTGTMHVGRAVGLPMVIIAPAWSPPVEWLPLGDPRFTVLKNLDLPAATPDYVIDEVSVADVTAALDDLLTRYPPRPH